MIDPITLSICLIGAIILVGLVTTTGGHITIDSTHLEIGGQTQEPNSLN